ncbi:MAG: exonuclease subunit SbcD, partial [Myxococcota bacterium]
MYRLLHTADWHLGQSLHGVSRAYEHGRFLDWLLQQIERHAVDGLVIAGDIFDVASPSAAAQAQYFGFLAEARRRYPKLDVVVVGGNHDAAARLDAARTVLDALRIRVVGGLPWSGDRWDLDRILVPLGDDGGELLLVAVPFLRPRDLPRSWEEARARAGLPTDGAEIETLDPETEGPIALGHRALYAALAEAAETRRPPGGALLATGHAYVSGSQLSELSERKIQQGNQQALAASTFPANFAYIALGHLHLAQVVGQQPETRYSGSPIPLSMAELDYPHQVLLADFEGAGLHRVTPALVPRFVELHRV